MAKKDKDEMAAQAAAAASGEEDITEGGDNPPSGELEG